MNVIWRGASVGNAHQLNCNWNFEKSHRSDMRHPTADIHAKFEINRHFVF